MKRLVAAVIILLLMVVGAAWANVSCEGDVAVQCIAAPDSGKLISLGPIPALQCYIVQVDGTTYCSPCENGRELKPVMLSQRCNDRYPACNGKCMGGSAW